jgi:hypothetical protein
VDLQAVFLFSTSGNLSDQPRERERARERERERERSHPDKAHMIIILLTDLVKIHKTQIVFCNINQESRELMI